MKICVTGARGFIGSHTIKKLVEQDHEVLAIDRNGNNDFGYSKKVNQIRIDVTDKQFLRNVFEREKPDAILHLAANSSLQRSITDASYDAFNNVIGTVTMLGIAQHYKVKRFVFASTSAVYGPQESGEYNEDDPVIPQVPYGVSKAAGEMYVRCSGLSYAILRYGNVYGPGQKPLGENILIARALAHMIDGASFKINGDGENVRDFVYVEDVAEANIKALFSDANGTFNIATGRGVTVFQIVQELQNLTGHKDEVEYGPANSGELRTVVLNSLQADLELGWHSRTRLVDGLAETQRAWMS